MLINQNDTPLLTPREAEKEAVTPLDSWESLA